MMTPQVRPSVVLALAGAGLGTLAAVPVVLDGSSPPVMVALALLVGVQSVALSVIERRPVLAAVVGWAGAVGLAFVAPYAGSLGAVNIALGGLARWRRWPVPALGLVAVLALAPWNLGMGGPPQMLLAVLLALLAWTLGVLARVSAARRAEQAQRVRAEAVTAIARDVHDVLAHSLAVVTVHSNAAREVFDTRPDLARRSLEIIDTVSRGALADLRGVLSAVRADAGNGGVRLADPEDLDVMADKIRASGLRVVLDRRGQLGAGEGGRTLTMTVHRIVQEALTNVVRHASASEVYVGVAVEDHQVRVVVEDDGIGSAHRAGYGLVGMTERAALLGGTLSTGRGARGGFRVEATLPRADGR